MSNYSPQVTAGIAGSSLSDGDAGQFPHLRLSENQTRKYIIPLAHHQAASTAFDSGEI